jgi:hypothetical protein
MVQQKDDADYETFNALHDEVIGLLERAAESGPDSPDRDEFGAIDAWSGVRRLLAGVGNLELLREPVIEALRLLLRRYRGWEIEVDVYPTKDEDNWPDMALYIRADLIIDGLQRQYLPPEYQSISYPHSRPGGEPDSLYPNYNPDFDRLKAELRPLFADATARMGLPAQAADLSSFGKYSGTKHIMVPVSSLRLIEPDVVAEIRALLANFRGWHVALVPSLMEGPLLPAMAVVVRHDGVLDGLVRSALPDPWRTMRYPDSRPLPE